MDRHPTLRFGGRAVTTLATSAVKLKECAWMDSNHRPPSYKDGALTAELQARFRKLYQKRCKIYLCYLL